MDLKEVQSYFEQNKDSEDVKAFVSGLNPVTTDRVKSLVNEDSNLKSWFDSERDKHLSKGIETFKTNNLDNLVSAKVKELYPDADPKDLKYKELEDKFNNAEKARLKETLTNSALKTAQEKKLPTDLIDYFVGSDAETTTKNLEKLIATMAAHDEAIKLEFAKGNSYTPPADKGNVSDADKLRDEVRKWMK